MSRFEIRPPFIVFHDDKPGQHATLFAPNGRRLPFRSDASAFNDQRNTYAWAFEGALKDGETIVFATSDREVIGKMIDGAIEVDGAPGSVNREEGKPRDLAGELLPTVDKLMEPPHPVSRERPTPMARPGTIEISSRLQMKPHLVCLMVNGVCETCGARE